MSGIENWVTREQLDKLLGKGLVEKRTEARPEEGRILIELMDPVKHTVTFRSLPLPAEGQLEIPVAS